MSYTRLMPSTALYTNAKEHGGSAHVPGPNHTTKLSKASLKRNSCIAALCYAAWRTALTTECTLANISIGALPDAPQMLKVLLTSATKQHVSLGLAAGGGFLGPFRAIMCTSGWGICLG